MPVLVIGGHSRSIGKTSVVAGIIAALPEFNWTAMKITQYGHGICSANGELCDCATDDHTFGISEEKDSSGGSDTSRFLKAGAARVWWVRARQGFLAEAMPSVRQHLAESTNVILESNSILKFLRPDLYLAVLDPAIADFKPSAQQFLDRADALILHDRHGMQTWRNVSLKSGAARPVFHIQPPQYVTPEMVRFVRRRLTQTAGV